MSPCSVLTDEDDITDLSSDPAHYQLLSQLGRDPVLLYSMIQVSYSLMRVMSIAVCLNLFLMSMCVWVFLYICAGRGFNNLSQVSMARHTPSGRLVAVKNTNLDECTEDELLQLMVCNTRTRASHCFLLLKIKLY